MIRTILAENRKGSAVGVWSVCSAHSWVLEAALAESRHADWPALIEATSNQVNQFGGYTGKTPAVFAEEVQSLAAQAGLPSERLVLGGDHLGPYPWRKRPAAEAMANARTMVRDYVLAGFVKIHLDASMPCGGDAGPALVPEVAAQRAAELCQAAEAAWRQLPEESPAPLYVIGTEVPVPGGEQLSSHGPVPTKPEDVEETVEVHRAAFRGVGIEAVFERVIGLVVQPGVEFGSSEVFDYDRNRAKSLRERLPESPELVYEAHSTDYQTARALRELVEDHFAILKVGPWLTFAMREAVFALSQVEREWLGWRRGARVSRVPDALEEAMLKDPAHWKDYYAGDEGEAHLARKFSYSDRSRYYWPVPSVRAELDVLVRNLAEFPPPLNVLSQFLPAQCEAIRAGLLENNPESVIRDRVRGVLGIYATACGARPPCAREP